MRYNVRIAVFGIPKVRNGILHCTETLSESLEWHVAVCGSPIQMLGIGIPRVGKAYPEVRNRYTESREGKCVIFLGCNLKVDTKYGPCSLHLTRAKYPFFWLDRSYGTSTSKLGKNLIRSGGVVKKKIPREGRRAENDEMVRCLP